MITFATLLALAALPGAAEFADQAQGVWTSAEQSREEAYDFVASETWRIWQARNDGVWLYQQNWILAENASSRPGRMVRTRHERVPYFQVVIQLRDFGDGDVHTTTYRLKPGARRTAQQFAAGNGAAFSEEWLDGVACMGRLKSVGERYWQGSASCPNAYKGGVRVESISVRSPGSYVNWDRGFDGEGEHIWGPSEGGYIFTRWRDQ